MRLQDFVFSVSLVAWAPVACAGAAPGSEPKAPAAPEPASAPAPPSKQAIASVPAAEPSMEAEPETEPAASDPFRLVRTPKDIVTAGDTAFVLSFGTSDAGEQADARCREKVGDDRSAHQACVEKLRGKVTAEILTFVNKNEQWWWVTYDKRGDQLVTMHKIPFEFGEVTEQTVALRPTGKDKGLAPLARLPRQFVITVPNEYSIEVNDPVHGRLVYEAKIGILGS